MLGSSFATCDVPQELSDSAIDEMLDEEAFREYVADSKRPPLDKCSTKEFEADLCGFLKAIGEDAKAQQISLKKVQRYATCDVGGTDLWSVSEKLNWSKCESAAGKVGFCCLLCETTCFFKQKCRCSTNTMMLMPSYTP